MSNPLLDAAPSERDDALAHAEDQVEAMTGDFRTPVRFRLLDQRHGIEEKDRRPSIQLSGSLADDAFCNELWRLNCDGYDVYIVAQGVRATLPATASVSKAHIEEARVIFADADDHAPITADECHIAPTAILRRENSDRHFWLLWRVEDMPLAAISDMLQRIVQRYGTDRNVCDPARVIRLAGFTSHKREEKTRYVFEAGSGKAARYSAHADMLPKVQRAAIEKSDGGEDYISEERLRLALASIDPSCGRPGDACRNAWIATLGAIVDAKIGREDRTYMEDFDKFDLADEWSSGALGRFGMPANYQGFDDVVATMEHLSRAGERKRAGIGSIIQMAKAAGMNEIEHRRLQKREPFIDPANARNSATAPNAASGAANDAAPTKPEGLYDGPEYGTRPEVKWLIPGALPEASYSIASGRSQAGKSFCELALALSIATGKPWLGLTPETTGPVLYIAAEGQGRIWRDVCAWCAEFGVEPDILRGRFFIFDRSARLNTEEGRNALHDIRLWIEHAAGRPLTYAVFDTLRRNMRGGVSQEDPTSEMLHEVNKLQADGVAVTLVAHQGRGHDDAKGLTDWEDDADGVRTYSGTVRDRTTKIEFKKVKAGEDGWSIAVKYTARQLPDGKSAPVASAGARQERNEPKKGGDAEDNRRRSKHDPRPDPALTKLLDRAVIETVRSVPAKEWTTIALAEALPLRDDIEISSATLARRTLKELRENKETEVYRLRLYDPTKRRWIWRSR